MSTAMTKREARAAADRRRAQRSADRTSSTPAAAIEAPAVIGLDKEPAAPPNRTPFGARRAADFSSLQVAAEAEYAYIARDIRRIIRIGGGTLGLMLGLSIALNMAGAL